MPKLTQSNEEFCTIIQAQSKIKESLKCFALIPHPLTSLFDSRINSKAVHGQTMWMLQYSSYNCITQALYIYIVGGLRVASSRIMCLLTTPGGHLLEYQTGMHVTKLITPSHITSVLYNLCDDQNLPQWKQKTATVKINKALCVHVWVNTGTVHGTTVCCL